MRRFTLLVLVGLAPMFVGCDEKPQGDQRATPGTEAPGARAKAEPQKAEPKKTEKQATKPTLADDREDAREDAAEARELLAEAAKVLDTMKSDERLSGFMKEAKGLYIVPEYGRAAAGAGAHGGEGVLVLRNGDKWSGPAFYDIGGVSVGAQLGAEGGPIAMVLMSDEAVDSFEGDDTFSIEAGAKLTLADYSTVAGEALTEGTDVLFWSATKGAFGGVTLSATDISWDDDDNRAYYGVKARREAILSGKTTAVSGKKGPLDEALSGM